VTVTVYLFHHLMSYVRESCGLRTKDEYKSELTGVSSVIAKTERKRTIVRSGAVAHGLESATTSASTQ
jgi:hypothetical protein